MHRLLPGLPAAVLALWPPAAGAVLGNSWHLPANAEPPTVTMRDPLHPCDRVFLYNGTYSLESDQSGGHLVYRLSGAGAWVSNALSFNTQVGDNKYWVGQIAEGTFCRDDLIEYYIRVTYTDDDTTFLGTTNNSSSTAYASESIAQSDPFTFTNKNCNYGNAWHIPANPEPSGAFMRDPPTEGPNPGQALFFYNGNQFAGGGNAGNQTGATLYHHLQGSLAPFATNNLTFNVEQGNNKYWITDIPAATYGAGDVVEYFLRVAYADHATTWLGSSNNTHSAVVGGKPKAEASPFTVAYGFDLGNAWHFPQNLEPPGASMRNPISLPQTNQSVFIYNGNQFGGAGTPGDQSGGQVVHRRMGDPGWSSNAMVFNAESGEVGNNKYWRGEIPGGAFEAGDTVEYFLRITYVDRDVTYIGTTDGSNNVLSGLQSAVETQLFSYTYSDQLGLSAAFMWHANNHVPSGDAVEFWVKIGYADGSGGNRFVDAAHVYYTTNGTEPHGNHGLPTTPDTRVADMVFSHLEEDGYEGGEAMWWRGIVTGLPFFTPGRYKIGAYKNAGTPERYADYNTSGTDSNVFIFTLGVQPEGLSLTVNGVEADYTATKFYIDEIAGDTGEVVVVFRPNDAELDVDSVEVLSNLGRRDWVDVDYSNAALVADGIPDGIKPPNANFLTPADTGAYFRVYPMVQNGALFFWTGRVSRTGAYRLTARYQRTNSPPNTYLYYTDQAFERRDHAIVASPRKTLDMTLYELNTLTVEAQAANEGGRSTFQDLLSAAQGDNDLYDPFNLEYLDFLQANCLWFQPIHPNGEDRAENDPAGGGRYMPGSPYATRDYWAVTKAMGSANTEQNALDEFTNFVAHCDAYTGSVGTINIMLDGVFNHTSWDAEMGQGGVDLGLAGSADARIGTARPAWFALITDYGQQGTFYNSAFDNNFATAPDRGDFGKWADVTELYFGKYAALVRHNPENNGDYLNEADWFDFSDLNSNQIELWRYFAYYTEFWLEKTGHPGSNTYVLAQDDRGIDALRCDFGQGLPPPLWEYIINRTRRTKWNFVFMAETLDGGIPGYRSNRHFDLLNENLVFLFTQSKINNSQDLVAGLESRRVTYNGGAILLNQTSHDEVMPDNDAWVTASRYGAVSSVAGLPMIFYGQEKGIGLHDAGDPGNARDGFADHELNFGKHVPHFKRWNQLQTWFSAPPFSGGLDAWYGRVNRARLESPALRSRNQWFLDLTTGGRDPRIFAVAKYQTSGAGPLDGDVVLAFARFIEHGQAHTAAANTYDLRGGGDALWNLLGLDINRLYTIRNLAASDPLFLFTSGWPQSGVQLYNDGLFVSLGAGSGAPITNNGEVVQYLKLVEVTEDLPYDANNDGMYDGWEWKNFTNLAVEAGDDADADGISNGDEFLARTNPQDNQSVFRAVQATATPLLNGRAVTVATEPGRKYAIQYADGTFTNHMAWQFFATTNAGVWIESAAAPTNHQFLDDESAQTTGGPPPGGRRAYRVLVGDP